MDYDMTFMYMVGREGAHLNDSWVLFTSLDKLLVRQLCVLITIHISEDLIYPLNGRR